MEMTLAEFLGWEENVEYRRGGNIFKVDGNHLMDLRSSDYWGNTCCETWELLELRNAVRVKPKSKNYYLRHKFIGSKTRDFLNYLKSNEEFYLSKSNEISSYQTQFTEDEINEIEATGFDLRNFEKVRADK